MSAWLAPLGAVFGGCAALRASLYRSGAFASARLAGPVVSVGNLSVGGSGKTPVVALVATLLQQAGHPVSILSRGYGGTFRGDCLVVSDGAAILADAGAAGDEPVMLARALPGVVVAVGPRRDVAGRIVESRFGPRVHVLDDGFQHLRLARDLDLVCLDPRDLDERPLPAGRLREFPSSLRRADMVLAWRATDAVPKLPAVDPERTFWLTRRVEGFFDPAGAPRSAPLRPFLLSGIARPERFVADVRTQVTELAGQHAFADHHRFTAAELGRVAEAARRAGADAIVTTAKDVVRIAQVPQGPPLLVLRITAEVADAARFQQRLLAAAARKAA